MRIMKKTVAIIGTVGVPANYGGFETLAEHLIENLGERYNLHVFCSGKKYPKQERKKQYKGAHLHYIPLDANGIQSIPYDTLSILRALFFADVLLILGVSGAWLLPFVRFFTNKKIIISIDGIEWNLLASWYLFWAEGLAVKYSHVDISDNEAIQDYTAKRYGTLSRIIEYGADHTIPSTGTSDRSKYPFTAHPYAFKVCRIEPENNVHIVLKVFSELPEYRLVMVGNWEKSDYGRDLRQTYSSTPNIYLLDPIYDQQELDMLRSNAVIYIHGHSAGGTNPSLVEAMYLGLPIAAFGVSYNRVTTENRALYFRTEEELKGIIQNHSLAEIGEIGKSMSEIARRRYRWGFIAGKYNELVLEALETTKKPSTAPWAEELSYNDLLGLELSHLKYSEAFYTKR